ncbi:hypothetical protein [Reyranella sp.]|jgi:hypothetical protein|uniref:hypothetical protein n=1 Tax=Reyranella sp. TaxID=1929291 RepID=UPI002F958C0C
MKRLALFFAALIGMAGIAQAQSVATSIPAPAPSHHMSYRSGAMAQSCGHQVSITDEYGFKYDSMGDRLNVRGCVIPPPHTRPGAKAIQG